MHKFFFFSPTSQGHKLQYTATHYPSFHVQVFEQIYYNAVNATYAEMAQPTKNVWREKKGKEIA